MKNLTTNSPIADGSTGTEILAQVDFVELRLQLQKRVYYTNIIYGGLLSEEDCEDIVQDLLLLFVEKCRQGEYDINRRTPLQFLSAKQNKRIWGPVCKRTCNQKTRKQLPETTADDLDDDICETTVSAGDPYSIKPDIFRNDIVNDLLRIINNDLSESNRQILLMKAEGISNEEIAEILHLPYGTATTRICRARSKAKSALEENGYHSLLCCVA